MAIVTVQLRAYRRLKAVWVLSASVAAVEAVVWSAGWDPVWMDSNSAGTRGANEERIEELRLSRSRLSRTRVPLPAVVDDWRGEPPFNMWDGMADGLAGPGGEPAPIENELRLLVLRGGLKNEPDGEGD